MHDTAVFMNTALVYDWLVTIAGGEKTLQAVRDLFPSPIFTLVYDPKLLSLPEWGDAVIKASCLQKLPFAAKWFRNLLPLFPRAIESFDLSSYDVVVSCSHSVAKGALTHSNQLHICYCFTPMRYAWDLHWDYMSSLGGIKRVFAERALHRLRGWDFASSFRVDSFVAISSHVARRIRKVYGREAKVIYPPVATHLIKTEENKEEFYLTAGRLVPYKRVDLIVEAFGAMPKKKLLVVGDGPEMKKVKAKAGKNVEILGCLQDSLLRELMAKAKAFIFAAEEDFGIAPVEAQAAGTPVIAFGRGGVLETVTPGKTGLFFAKQSVESIVRAVEDFEQRTFDPREIGKSAGRFSEARFKEEFKSFVKEKWEAFCEDRHFGGR